MFSSFDKNGAATGLDLSEIGLLIFAAAVAFGLIGEYMKDRGDRWRGLSDTFELLVIVGVVGELIFDGLIFGFSERLSALQDVAVSVANSTAGQAHERAGSAEERAGAANKLAGEANERAGEANERAAKANERAASLEVLAAEQKRKNLAQEKEIVELKSRQLETAKQINVREISQTQRDAFAASIRGNQQQITLILPDEQEPRAYGDEILSPVLRRAGFLVKVEDLGGTSKYSGIMVCKNNAGELRLFQAFRKANIPARIFRRDRPDFCNIPFGTQATLRVFVGQRLAPLGKRNHVVGRTRLKAHH